MRRTEAPRILAVNPWIHDFAAYDFWARPLGLLYLISMLKKADFPVDYVDCLARPKAPGKRPHEAWGCGPYPKTKIPAPAVLADVPRTYCRYGAPVEAVRDALSALPPPDVVLVTCLMTYWHPGAFEAIRLVRELFPKTKIILGGIYATLFPDHARQHSGADIVVEGPGERAVFEALSLVTGAPSQPPGFTADFCEWPLPVLPDALFAPLLGSLGCPFRCSYCAAGFLQKSFRPRSAESLLAEIRDRHFRLGIRDFAFYDDALLVDANERLLPVLDAVAGEGLAVRFHAPNAVHARLVTPEIAEKLFKAGMKTLRLGLETTGVRLGLDAKVSREEFFRASAYLKEAGFGRESLGAYLLTGLPGEDPQAIAESVADVETAGIRPIPAFYSPMPQTALWEPARAASRYDLAAEPLCTNNSIFPCRDRFSWSEITRLRRLCAP